MISICSIFVQAKNNARADVYPIVQLKAVTKDNSKVYYYKKPPELSVDSKESSNVLFLQQYNNSEYNKRR